MLVLNLKSRLALRTHISSDPAGNDFRYAGNHGHLASGDIWNIRFACEVGGTYA